MKLFIGLMSGTSMDGIDAALLDVDTNRLLAGIIRPYSEDAKQQLQQVLGSVHTTAAVLSQLNTIIGREFAAAVLELLAHADKKACDIVAIGSHGQTICHDPYADIPYTVQLGCAHTIAELTGMTVVADFRTRDLVNGGQGAPFAPLYHQVLFAQIGEPLALVNIGGIANVSYISAQGHATGHDIGPGNCLLDAWIQLHCDKPYDANGAWAATGQVIIPLLQSLMNDPCFKRVAPKSLGKEYFSSAWLMQYLQPNYTPEDVQATLLALTAVTIAEDIKNSPVLVKQVAICGGGAHNKALQAALKQQLPQVNIQSTESLGIDPDFMEAMMFAWLADKTLSHIPLDLKAITGARKMAVLGAIYAAGL